MNYTQPVEYDTLDIGCEALTLGGDGSGCTEEHSYNLDGSLADTWYQCNGLKMLRICAKQYTFSGAGQCVALPTTDCIEVTDWEHSDECQNVQCRQYTENEVNDLQYNQRTKCWDGSYRTMSYMVCSNGSRSFPEYGSYQPYTVCDDYLDSLGTTVEQYVGGSYSGPGVSGGSGTDAQGNSVENGPGGGGSGGYWDSTYQYVTEYDSSTGRITVVKTPSGTDSTALKATYTTLQCLGVNNGVATLSNGKNTWTCAGVQSCSQAELKYKLGSGCGAPGGSGSNSTPDYSSNTPHVTWSDSVITDIETGLKDFSAPLNNLSKTATWFYNYFAFPGNYPNFSSAINAIVSAVNGGTELSRSQRDSIYDDAKTQLWKRVFGDNLSNVKDLKDSATAVKIAIEDVGTDVRSVETSVNSASSNISLAVGDAAVSVQNSVSGAASTVSSRITSAASSINTAMGSNTAAVQGSIMSHSGRVADSLHGLHRSLDSLRLVEHGDNIATHTWINDAIDTLRASRDTLHGIHSSVDDYMRMIGEQNFLTNAFNDDMRDSLGQTNSILRDIRDAMGAAPPSSSSGSPASSGGGPMAEADSSYADSLDYGLDPELDAADSAASVHVARVLDSIRGMRSRLTHELDSTYAHVDSVRAADNNNLLAMDSIYKWHKDTTRIKQKLPGVFLPSTVSNNCFACTYRDDWFGNDVDLRIDFGNVYGLNICELLRTIVRVLTAIFIIFSTIGAFIKAFGGGGGGGT